VLSMADFRAARRGFWATAVSFAAIGLVLGIMTTWPLPARIIVCAAFLAVAGGGLIWILDYLRIREALGIEAPVSQPDIILLPPVHTYKLTWNASSNLEITLLPERRPEETDSLKTGVPIFRVKNLGSGVAKDVTVEWEAKNIDLNSAIEKSERLKSFVIKLNQTNFGIFSAEPDGAQLAQLMSITGRGVVAAEKYKGYAGAYSQNQTTELPYLAPEINNTSYQEAILPLPVAHLLEVYIVATMPEGSPYYSRIPVPILATIRWKSPEGGKPSRFRIDATAISTKSFALIDSKPINQTPDIQAEVQFTVTPLDK